MEAFFKDCTTIEELKQTYHKLVFKHHPDRGGDTETMKRINIEYEKAFARLKDTHRNAEGECYEASRKTTEKPETLIRIIETLINVQGINIEICGSWVWVTGNTKPAAGTLKGLGFYWSNSKTAWYWYDPNTASRSKNKKHYTLNEIRDMHGSEKVETRKETGLTVA